MSSDTTIAGSRLNQPSSKADTPKNMVKGLWKIRHPSGWHALRIVTQHPNVERVILPINYKPIPEQIGIGGYALKLSLWKFSNLGHLRMIVRHAEIFVVYPM
jgi:hypothetical protein